MPDCLPFLALSVRQPWAWAIATGAKIFENRSLEAIRSGCMAPGRICIHAATGLKKEKYAWAVDRLQRHGLVCPKPLELVRGAIIGTVEVTGIVTESDSDWFGGNAGLTLANAQEVEPIRCPGALGYFKWQRQEMSVSTPKWMETWGLINDDAQTADLFGDLPVACKSPPTKPFRRKRPKP